GGVRPPAFRGGAVPRRGQGVAGLGSVPGAAVDRLPPQQSVGHVGLQFPGRAGAGAEATGNPARAFPRGFFPLGPTAGASGCRKCIAVSITGSWSRHGANPMIETATWMIDSVSRSFALCAGDKAVLGS